MPQTRHKSGGIDPAVVFPDLSNFSPPTKLPTNRSVVGVLQNVIKGSKGANQISTKDAVREVAKRVYAKYYHDTVYCMTLQGIIMKLDNIWSIFKEGRKRFNAGMKTGKAIDNYKELVDNADKLFDVGITTSDQKDQCKKSWGVAMSEAEDRYYEDQKTQRRMECDKQVDPVWYWAMMKKERMKSRQEEWRQQRQEQFKYKDIEEITDMLCAGGEIEAASSNDVSLESPEKAKDNIQPEKDKSNNNRRKLFVNDDSSDTDIPSNFAHIRDSERKVRDEFYLTVAALSGHGMSLSECCLAVVEVGNGMFGRNWKLSDSDSENFDINTLPEHRNIRSKLQMIEVETLSHVVDAITTAKESGRAITASIDSTTKRGVGTFATQGLSVGQECPLTLPLLGISGETTEEVALQVDMGFEILAICSGSTAKEVYSNVSVHMTDSVSHNKGIAKELQTLYDLDKPAGQLFCGSHTTLGFSSSLNKKVSIIESDMKIDQVLSKFMVSMELDSKNGSLAGQAMDMCLKLVAPEFSHKQWNYYKQYTSFLQQEQVTISLFSYKDNRFGCLSRAAGVLLHNLPHLDLFLSLNPHINNKLACLVRELLDLPYLKVEVFGFAISRPLIGQLSPFSISHWLKQQIRTPLSQGCLDNVCSSWSQNH